MKLTRKIIPKSSDSGTDFLKIEDGQTVNVVFRGEVHEFYQIWPFGGEKQIFDKKVPGSSMRFKVNVVVHEKGKFVAKIFEFTNKFYNQMVDLQDDFPLTETKFKITRHGVEKNTTYTLLPLIKEPLAPKALKEIEAVPLNMLEHNLAPSTDADYEYKGPSDDDEPVF